MNRILVYMLLVLALISCAGKESGLYTLNGKVGDTECTVYLFGIDNRYERIDSIAGNDDGEFSFSMKTDTVIPLMLLLPDGVLVPVYAEPGIEAQLRKDYGMKNGWCIDGGTTQALHDSISRELDACNSDNQVVKIMDEFLEANPINDVNIEIMRRYAVDIKEPKPEKIRKQISGLGGLLQDQEFFATIKRKVDHKKSNAVSRSFPAFNYTTAEGKEVSLPTYIRKYTLVTFWATWDEESRAVMQSLRELKENVDSTYFAILNIALDSDTLKWRECITADSIVGDNAVERKGWNGGVLKEFNIPSLPYSMLLTPYQRVNRYDVDLNSALEIINPLVEKHKRQLKEQEQKKKNRK